MGIVGTLFAAAISVTFCVLYSNQLNGFDEDTHTCIATRGSPDDFESYNVYDNYLFVLKFGFGVYLAQSVILIVALPSGFNKIFA